MLWVPQNGGEEKPTFASSGFISHDTFIEFDEEHVKKLARQNCFEYVDD